jgi:hypothetical protein
MTVGSEELPSKPLVEYALTVPGIHTAIIGTGHIDEDPLKCQLIQNFYAAQIEPDALTEEDRRKIEERTKGVKDGKTNYFQLDKEELSSPQNLRVKGFDLAWDTAIAGDEPVQKYQIYAGDALLGEVKHKPQIDTTPFTYEMPESVAEFRIAAVDRIGRKTFSDVLRV